MTTQFLDLRQVSYGNTPCVVVVKVLGKPYQILVNADSKRDAIESATSFFVAPCEVREI